MEREDSRGQSRSSASDDLEFAVVLEPAVTRCLTGTTVISVPQLGETALKVCAGAMRSRGRDEPARPIRAAGQVRPTRRGRIRERSKSSRSTRFASSLEPLMET